MRFVTSEVTKVYANHLFRGVTNMSAWDAVDGDVARASLEVVATDPGLHLAGRSRVVHRQGRRSAFATVAARAAAIGDVVPATSTTCPPARADMMRGLCSATMVE